MSGGGRWLPPHDPELLMRARAARAAKIVKHERSIVLLRACTCGYPIVRLHNAHGHAETCPAATLVGSPLRSVR